MLFASFWADTESDYQFHGNMDIPMDAIRNQTHVEAVERIIRDTLVEQDVPVTTVTLLNWKNYD